MIVATLSIVQKYILSNFFDGFLTVHGVIGDQINGVDVKAVLQDNSYCLYVEDFIVND